MWPLVAGAAMAGWTLGVAWFSMHLAEEAERARIVRTLRADGCACPHIRERAS